MEPWWLSREYRLGGVPISVDSPQRRAVDIGIIVWLGGSGVWLLHSFSPSWCGTDTENDGLLIFMTTDEKLDLPHSYRY